MTVEDVGGMPPARINRIVGADLLDRSCAPDARLESRLPRRLPSNRFFQQHWSKQGSGASKCFRLTSKEKPRESGASSRFGVCQDSLGSGEIGELSSPPLTLAVSRLAEIHSKEPGLHRSVRRSPQSVARPVKEIASELLVISEPEVSLRKRRSIRESFLRAELGRLDRRLRNGAADRADNDHRHSNRNRRPDDQPRNAAVSHDRLHP